MKNLIKSLSLVILLTVALLSFVGCAKPANLEKAKEVMSEAGYEVSVDYAAEDDEDGKVGTITAIKSQVGLLEFKMDIITATQFKDAKAAKAYYDANIDPEAEGDKLLKLEGKWVYFGTEDAIKLFFDKD